MQMFVLANLIYAVALVLNIVVMFLIAVIVIDAFLSFIVPYGFPMRRIFDEITRPLLKPLRKVIPTFGMLDLTPFIAILILIFVQAFFVNTLFDLSTVLK